MQTVNHHVDIGWCAHCLDTLPPSLSLLSSVLTSAIEIPFGDQPSQGVLGGGGWCIDNVPSVARPPVIILLLNDSKSGSLELSLHQKFPLVISPLSHHGYQCTLKSIAMILEPPLQPTLVKEATAGLCDMYWLSAKTSTELWGKALHAWWSRDKCNSAAPRWEHAAEFSSLNLELFGGHQLILRSFRGAPVWKLKIFYLPKNT